MQRLAVLQRHLSPLQVSELDRQGLQAPACSAYGSQGGAVLVGGMVLDLQAHPTTAADVRRGGSVPGRVAESPGGVARNIAENLARLCQSAAGSDGPLLVSVVGEDMAGQALLAHMESAGMTTKGVLQLAKQHTPTVAVVFDRSGEVAACVADVGLVEEALTPAVVAAHQRAIVSAPVVMLDGNLSPAAIKAASAAAATAGVPVWFEPVSAPKSVRATAVLQHLAYVSPNEAELVAMAEAVWEAEQQAKGSGNGRAGLLTTWLSPSRGSLGTGGSRERGLGSSNYGGSKAMPAEVVAVLEPLRPHISTLLRTGVGHVVLTLGPLGAVLCTLHMGSRMAPVAMLLRHLPALPAKVANCSGAGDCLVAGCLFGLQQGSSPLQAMAYGVAAAKCAVESHLNVPPALSRAELESGADDTLRQASSLVVGL